MQYVFRPPAIVQQQQKLLYIPASTSPSPPDLAPLLNIWAKKMRLAVYKELTRFSTVRFIPGDVQTVNNVVPIKSLPRQIAGPQCSRPSRYVPGSTSISVQPLPISKRMTLVPRIYQRIQYRTMPIQPPQVPIVLPVRRSQRTVYLNRSSRPILPLHRPDTPLVSRRLRDYPSEAVSRMIRQYIPAAVQTLLVPLPIRQTRTSIIRTTVNRTHPVMVRNADRFTPIRGTSRQVVRPGEARYAIRFVPQVNTLVRTSVRQVTRPGAVRHLSHYVTKGESTVPVVGRTRILKPAATPPVRLARIIPAVVPQDVLIPHVRQRIVTKHVIPELKTRYVPAPPVRDTFAIRQTRTIVRSSSPTAKTTRVVPAIVPPPIIIPRLRQRIVTQHAVPELKTRYVPTPPAHDLLVVRQTRTIAPKPVGVRRGMPFTVNRDVLVPTMFPVVRVQMRPYKVQCPRRVAVASILVPPPIVQPIIMPQKRVVR